LEEIEQNIIVDDVLPPGEYVPVIPKNRRHEKGELQQIADDQLDVAKTGAQERKQRDGPKSVDEQEQDAGKSQQRDPMQRNDPERDGDRIEDEMVAKGDENAKTHARDVEVDAQGGREYVIAVAYENGRPFADLRRDGRPHDDAEPDVGDQVADASPDDGRGNHRDAERHHQDVDSLPQRADLGSSVLANGIQPSPGQTLAQVAQ